MTEAVYRTVRGDVPVGEVGPALFHEHLISDASAWNPDPDLRCTDPALVAAELRTAALDGVGLLVDATPIDFGRDLGALAEASAHSGVHVIAGTGLYREISYPAWLDDWDHERLAQRFVDDIVAGADGSGIRAGVIGEVGCSETMTTRERRVLTAAAIAQQRTGAAIVTHTQEGRGALKQLEFLLGQGAEPARVIVGHLDCLGDVRVALAVIGLGANVGYDRIGLTQYVRDEERAAEIAALLDAGHADRVMLSGDQARPSQYRANGGEGFGKVLVRFVPLLRRLGVSEETIDQLLVGNPRRVLGMRPGPSAAVGRGELAVHVVHIVHDRGVDARGVPGEPRHRIGELGLGAAEQAVGADDLTEDVRGPGGMRNTAGHDLPPGGRMGIQGRPGARTAGRPAPFRVEPG